MNLRIIIREEINKSDEDIIGKELWFEYHCWESPESCDAELWYRSHQKVTVLNRGIDDHDEYPDEPKVYDVIFKDGFEGTVFADELMNSPQKFYRPNPPNINESDDMEWIEDVYTPQVGDTYKVLPQNVWVPSFNMGKNILTHIVITDIIMGYQYLPPFFGKPLFQQKSHIIKYTIQGDTSKHDYEIYLDNFLTAVASGHFVKIKEINESDDFKWMQDVKSNQDIAQEIADKTEIKDNRIYSPYSLSFSFPLPLLPLLLAPLFFTYCEEQYGLSENDINDVWERYKKIIIDRIHKPKKDLNESDFDWIDNPIEVGNCFLLFTPSKSTINIKVTEIEAPTDVEKWGDTQLKNRINVIFKYRKVLFQIKYSAVEQMLDKGDMIPTDCE